MAAGYTVVSQSKTVQVLSANQVIDVEEVGFVTSPSGVYAQRLVPFAAWAAQGAAAWIAPLAQAIEDLIAGGLAIGGQFVQDVDPVSQLLADFVEFTVAYDPGGGVLPMTTQVRVSVEALTADSAFGAFVPGLDPAKQLRDAYDALAATAAL